MPGASVDVQRTLKAMRGASEKEKKWVAMREKEKGNELFKAIAGNFDPRLRPTRCR